MGRTRRAGALAFLGLAAAFTVVAIAASLHRLGTREFSMAAPSASAPIATAQHSAATTSRLVPTRDSLGRGGTLTAALERLGLRGSDIAPVLRALQVYLDPRRMAPHTGLLALRDTAGVVRRLCVRTDASWFVRLELGPDLEIAIEKVELPTATDVEVVTGIVEDSVAQALAGRPGAGQLTAEYADIFQWDVDLHVDPRPGDEVRVVYETRRLAALPDDLPPFGGAADEPGELVGAGRILAASYLGALARAHAFLVDGGSSAEYYDVEGNPLRKSFLRTPLSYRRISSGFSNARRHPITRRVVPHHGVDYAAAPGTPVVAAADGRVASASWQGPLGQAVRIRHPNGYETVYGHLRAFATGVHAGAVVRQNDVIGYVGSTGRATGPHLHYSVLYRGQPIDPERMDNPPREPVPIDLRPKLRLAVERYSAWLELQPEGRGRAS